MSITNITGTTGNEFNLGIDKAKLALDNNNSLCFVDPRTNNKLIPIPITSGDKPLTIEFPLPKPSISYHNHNSIKYAVSFIYNTSYNLFNSIKIAVLIMENTSDNTDFVIKYGDNTIVSYSENIYDKGNYVIELTPSNATFDLSSLPPNQDVVLDIFCKYKSSKIYISYFKLL